MASAPRSPPEVFTLSWRDIEIGVEYTKNWLNTGFDHFSIKATEPLPITETGYRSHFIDPSDLTDYDGPADFVRYWLDVEGKDWSGQLSLF